LHRTGGRDPFGGQDRRAAGGKRRPTLNEQRVLRISIAVTVLIAGFGILVGLLSGSSSITFDGVYALTDASMTIVALMVARLIASSTAPDRPKGRLAERFSMGFWHLEPMVLGLNGVLLSGAAIYALINAVASLIAGGRELAFDQAVLYALVTVVCTVGMAWFVRRANRTIRSDFLALDAQSWIMSAALTAALLVAFLFGLLIQGTALDWLSPYVDPAVLALVCLVIIPMPAATVRRAMADIFLVTPPALKQHVDTVAQEMVQRYGFASYRSYVARVGRGRQIEIFFIVPPGWPPRQLEDWDRLRDEVGEAIGYDSPDRWLTIVFTADTAWAE